MNYITQAEKIFDNIEKWNAFLELYKIKKMLVNKWYDKLENLTKERIETEFNKNNKWKFKRWDTNSYGWYLKEYNEGSLTILLEYNCFCLWINQDLYDVNKIVEQYKSSNLFTNDFFKTSIINADNYLVNIPIQLFEKDSQDNDLFAWYLSQENENLIEFSNKVYEFFYYFMSNMDKIKIINEINVNCKKTNQ